MKPSGDQIAREAGVAPRTVFRHFEDLDSLFAAGEVEIRKHFETSRVGSDSGESFANRVRAFAAAKGKSFDARRNYTLFFINRMQSEAQTTQASLTQAERERLELWSAIPEFAALDSNGRHMAEVLYSSRCWDQLRYAQGLTFDETIDVIAHFATELLPNGQG